MNRRSYLRTGGLFGAAVLGGCTDLSSPLGEEAGATAPRARLDMEPITDAGITRRIHGEVEAREELFAEAVETGQVSVEKIRPPLHDGERLVYEGTLYEVSMRVTEQRPARVYPITLNDVAYDSVTPAPNADHVQFEDLPPVDKTVFRENNLASGELLGIGTQLVYPTSAIEESVLVPVEGYTVIHWDSGTRGQFSARHEARDATLSTYQYTLETVAESAAAYGTRIREQYTVDLSDVPEAEREILATAATGDPYRVPHGTTPSEPFESLAERFRDISDVFDAVRNEEQAEENTRSGTYLVRFDGEVYWTNLRITGPRSTG